MGGEWTVNGRVTSSLQMTWCRLRQDSGLLSADERCVSSVNWCSAYDLSDGSSSSMQANICRQIVVTHASESARSRLHTL